MRPRLADVAARAGVSIKTVSNVINDFPHISTQTREKVTAAIEELGYRPNLSARNLAKGRTGVIVLGVPRLDMPYFASLAMQLITAAEAASWWVQIRQTRGERAAELELLAETRQSRIDGMVLSPLRLRESDLAERSGLPLVMLGERRFAAVDHVGIDNAAAAASAVQHLLETGRRRIAVVGGPGRTDRRVVGARATLRAHGLDLPAALHLPVRGVTGRHGEEAMKAFLGSGHPMPEAVFCVTDWLAMGVIRALRLHGFAVPDDVAVMGFDDIPYDLAALPTLSTIAPDREEIARLAVASLRRQEGATAPEVQHTVVGHRLVPRESTAATGPVPTTRR
ncbi:LacI family transcriptional regulator [Desertihabitans brevis]|uniref:LacI family transcriptional regulator n=1 Tax=Desertihabitans brevis TaxID=2268447 RepID=A0A367Z185_9ACTN|nr:LacI family DNA-binding transcriptional regulator [Desertihabitans brevis]RCK70981.1 LacI family transcriptional regulator [Desertihabitans brevis]